MSYAVESFVVISAAVAIFGGLLAYVVVSLLGQDTTKIKTWLSRMAAVMLFMFVSWGTFMCYKNAFVLSRQGTPGVARAEFKKSYVPFRRVREAFVYDMVFDGHRIEKEYHYPLQSKEVRVVYNPAEPQHFMIGDATGSALQLFRSDMQGDLGFVFLWPVFVITSAMMIYFTWRGSLSSTRFRRRVGHLSGCRCRECGALLGNRKVKSCPVCQSSVR